MQAAVAQALAAPALQAQLGEQGATVTAGSPDDYNRLITDQIALWRRVVADAGIRPE